ncbi:UNVERIFIED_CONTAM: hypothetical protein Sradi_4381800 [Sesamum radiatum]|uniref:Uncharacterized protein n=1 Tax=Sesamum radiatum TaxID=300843 RepID=A0AAW2NRD2_SESRA
MLSSDTSSRKLEEKENAQLKEAKNEATSHRRQMEKELKRLIKESAGHEEALRKVVVEKAGRNYPHLEEGNDFLKAYWASWVDELKKSDEYQQEWRRWRYPFWKMASMPGKSNSWPEKDLDNILGEVEAEVRCPPPTAAID